MIRIKVVDHADEVVNQDSVPKELHFRAVPRIGERVVLEGVSYKVKDVIHRPDDEQIELAIQDMTVYSAYAEGKEFSV